MRLGPITARCATTYVHGFAAGKGREHPRVGISQACLRAQYISAAQIWFLLLRHHDVCLVQTSAIATTGRFFAASEGNHPS